VWYDDDVLSLLVQELVAMRAADASAKALIFSSFQATIESSSSACALLLLQELVVMLMPDALLLPHVLYCFAAVLLLQELVAMRADDASAKALIFSSFQATIDILLLHVLCCFVAVHFLQELVAMRASDARPPILLLLLLLPHVLYFVCRSWLRCVPLDASAKALIFSSFQATTEILLPHVLCCFTAVLLLQELVAMCAS
jgi:hypothetical protein